jgi:hypothetical protein
LGSVKKAARLRRITVGVMEPHDREAFRVSVAWAAEGAAGEVVEAEVVVIEALAAGAVATRPGATV